MRTIFAEYNPQRNSVDVYTSASYMLRIDCCNEKDAEKNCGKHKDNILCNTKFFQFQFDQMCHLIFPPL